MEEKYRYEVVQNITPGVVVIANMPTQGRDFTISGWDVVDLTRLFKPEEINLNGSLQNAIEKLKWLKVIHSEKDVVLPDSDSKPLAARMKLGDKIEALPSMYTQLLRLHEEREEMANLLELSKAGTAEDRDKKRLEELQVKFRSDEVLKLTQVMDNIPNPVQAAINIFKDKKIAVAETPKPTADEPKGDTVKESTPPVEGKGRKGGRGSRQPRTE